jgi:hypothetical protein
MKLLTIIFLLFLLSCSKEEQTKCWDCEMKEYYIDLNQQIVPVQDVPVIMCDETKETIAKYEQDNYFRDTMFSGDIYIIETKCK